MKIALVGDPDDARGFALAGVRTYVPDSAADARHVLAELARSPSIGLVLISAAVASLVPDVVDAHLRAVAHPAFLVVPPSETTGAPVDAP